MRTTPLLGVCALSLAFVLPAAGAGPDIRYITGTRAEVRCKPGNGPDIYVTNVLKQGDTVEVIGEASGNWLAIRPPRGSFSWINTRFLKSMPGNQQVITAPGEVEVYVGSEVLKGRPSIVGVKLKTGSIVHPIGRTLVDGGDAWMPIEPPAREERYILATDVSSTRPTQIAAGAGAQVRLAGKVGDTPAPAVFPASGATVTPAARPESPSVLYERAKSAQAAGQMSQAIQDYERLALMIQPTNPTLAQSYMNHAATLRRMYYPATLPPPSRAPANGTRTPAPGRTAAPSRQSVPSGEATPSTVRLAAPTGVSTTVSRVPASWVPQPAGVSGVTSSASGVLYRAGRTVEGRATYRLETIAGAPLLYITPQTGIDLEPYLNRNVEVHGPAVYRGDLRANYMTVTSAQPLP